MSAARGRAYCRGALKRGADLLAAGLALVVLAPILALLAILVGTTSRGPILFRQERIGLDGRPFRILKFRTMRPGDGLPITGAGDRRVTPVGALLRRAKLDELPQLWNVVRGEMSIVGPRPEVPLYVAGYGPAERRVLEARPGLTDPATLEYRDEERLLGAVPPDRREAYYTTEILPRKLRLNLAYVDGATFWGDALLVGRTLMAILLPERR
jgi:lipopolysaccharide/colanic/teichoic acid biosynthesis glycosyltransferase